MGAMGGTVWRKPGPGCHVPLEAVPCLLACPVAWFWGNEDGSVENEQKGRDEMAVQVEKVVKWTGMCVFEEM